MNLAGRLALALVLVALTAVSAVSGVAYWVLDRRLVPLEAERELQAAALLAQRLIAEVQELGAEVRAARGVAPASQLAQAAPDARAGWRPAVERVFLAQLAARPHGLQLRLLDRVGLELARVERAQAGGPPRVVPVAELQDKGDRPYFREAIELPPERLYVSPVELNQEHGAVQVPHVPVLRAALTVPGADGRAAGLVILNVDLGPVLAALRAAAPPEGAIYLLDGRGDFLLHPDPGREFGTDLGRASDWRLDLPALADAPPLASAPRSQLRSGRRFTAVPVQLTEGPRLTLVRVAPSQQGTLVQGARRPLLLVSLVTLVIAAAAAFTLARALTRPLTRMTAAAARIAAGESVSLPTDGPGEVGDLARALERMAASLDERRAAVAEREAEQRRHMTRVSLLNQIARSIVGRHDLYSVYHTVLEQLEARWPVEASAVYGCRPGHDEAQVLALGAGIRNAPDASPPEGAGVDPREAGISDCVRGEVVRVPDTAALPEPRRQFARRGLRSHLAVPLAIGDQVLGALVVQRAAPDAFAPDEQAFMRVLAGHVVLAARDAELHAELRSAHEQLQRSQEQEIARERLNALGQMASGIAHDFNNALTPILGFANLALEPPAGQTPPYARYLKFIQTAAEDAGQVVRRLREFYRPREAQDLFAPVDLEALVEEVVQLTQPRWRDQALAQGKTIEVVTDLERDGTRPQGSASELRELLTNLVFNAVDAIPPGAGTITIRTRHGQGASRVEVQDSGVGMDAELRRRCFEPFFTTKGNQGTGLGLASIHGIVRRHAGTIAVESAPGQGSTFTVELPRPASAPAPADPAAPPAAPAAAPRALRVLVAEDQPDVQAVIVSLLESQGHAAVTAADGQAALERLEADRFDLVLTDRAMPRLNGDQLARAILERWPALPVIMLSGFGDFMAGSGELPPGVTLVLSKPITLARLREGIERVFATGP